MPRFRVALCVAAVSLAGTALVACGGDDEEAEPEGDSQSQSQPVTGPLQADVFLSSPEGQAWIGLPVAREEGFLEEEQLEVKSEGADGSDFVIQQVIAGNAPFGFAAATSVLIGAQKDPSLRAVFCNTSRNVFGISVPEGSEITDVAGFEGKILGISEQGGGETPMVEAALLEAGLTPGADVQLLPIGGSGPAAERAISTGEVDGYASAYTDIIALQAAGVGLTDITPEQYTGVPGDCLVAQEETLADPESREIIVRLARAWSKGSLFAASNPDRALEIGCDLFPENCTDESFSRDYMNTRVELLTPVGAEVGQTDTPYGLPPVEGWQTAVDLLVASDQLEEPLDIEQIIGTEEVQSIIEEWSDYDREEIAALAVGA